MTDLADAQAAWSTNGASSQNGRHGRSRGPTGQRVHSSVLVVADLAGINLAFAAAYWLRYHVELGGPIEWYNYVPFSEYAPWGIGLSVILVVAYWLQGLYTRRRSC
jgi:hypothetical protein